MEKHINITFRVIWENTTSDISEKELNILKEGIQLKYCETTTIKEIFLELNKLFDGINRKQKQINYKQINTNRSLEYLYRIGFNKEAMYIFDLEIRVIDLLNYINSNSIEIVLTLFRGIGGEVHRQDGMKFYIHTREGHRHHEPHVHVVYSKKEITVNLLNYKITGKMPRSICNKAINVVKNNRESFLLKWNNIADGEKFEFKDYQVDRVF